MAEGVDAWISSQPDPKPTRSDVMRLALREWLERQDHLPTASGEAN